jgi:hypothetical protein
VIKRKIVYLLVLFQLLDYSCKADFSPQYFLEVEIVAYNITYKGVIRTNYDWLTNEKIAEFIENSKLFADTIKAIDGNEEGKIELYAYAIPFVLDSFINMVYCSNDFHSLYISDIDAIRLVKVYERMQGTGIRSILTPRDKSWIYGTPVERYEIGPGSNHLTILVFEENKEINLIIEDLEKNEDFKSIGELNKYKVLVLYTCDA